MKSSDMLEAIDRLVSPLLKAKSGDQAGASSNVSEFTKIVLAYSGGVDSEVLAAGLSAYSKQHKDVDYQLVHVHHGLSANAELWVKHCQQRAVFYGLPLAVERVQVSKASRESLEANARELRYTALALHLNADDILLTAQHEDDQLETLLLALKRGQGPKGLAAMGECQRKGHYWHCRPLLSFTRQDIEAYAANHSLIHIEDESNQDRQYDRNFLRLEIIPALKSRWPSIGQTASRSARLCAEQQQVIDAQVSERLDAWLDNTTELEGTGFSLIELNLESPAWQNLLFRGYLERLGVALPSSVQLEQILTQLLQAKDDAKIAIVCGEYTIKRFNNNAFVVPNTLPATLNQTSELHDLIAKARVKEASINTHIYASTDTSSDISTSTDTTTDTSTSTQSQTQASEHEQAYLAIPKPSCVSHKPARDNAEWRLTLSFKGARLRLPTDAEIVSLRFGAASSVKCQPHFRSKGRELKKLWQELQIPPWRRAQVPLIYYGERLVAAVGYWVDKGYLAQRQEQGIEVGLQG
jgi:tRNA(Ile)-lysidine synthase